MEDYTNPGPARQREWIRQTNLTYAGLLGIGVVMVQPFLAAESIDRSATICVVAFSVAIPLLAGLIMLNLEESFRERMANSLIVNITRSVAQTAAFVGLVAGFWHISWLAGVGMLASALVAVGVHSAGYVHLDRSSGGPDSASEDAS